METLLEMFRKATGLDIRLRLNRGGTIHTDEEIQQVRDLLAKEER
jgi:hypothetical protein